MKSREIIYKLPVKIFHLRCVIIAIYYCAHLWISFSIVNKLDSEDALSIKNFKIYLAKPNIKNDLIYKKLNFIHPPTLITKVKN